MSLLALTLVLLPTASMANSHERGYRQGKNLQKKISRRQFNRAGGGYNSHSRHNHGHHNNHHEHTDHYGDHHDHYDNHGHVIHHDTHGDHGNHYGHGDYHDHWFYSMNRNGFQVKFGSHR